MRRNMAQSLVEHETISTTIEKAKEIKPFVEKLITLAKKGQLQHRRRAISLLGDRDILDYEDGRPIKKGTVVGKLFSELGPRYLDRPGGYTRIIRLSLRRLGDNGELVLLQLLGADEPVKKERKASTKRRARKKKKEASTAPAAKAEAGAGQAEEGAQVEAVEAADDVEEKPQADGVAEASEAAESKQTSPAEAKTDENARDDAVSEDSQEKA
jgi:large subunit ribosomal protein L17